MPGRFQRRDRLLQMREGRVGQAAEIDHIRSGGAVLVGAGEDLVQRQGRRLDDLGEDAHVVAAQIDRTAGAAEMARQVLQIVRPALEGRAELGRERRQIHPRPPGEEDSRGTGQRPQPPAHDLGGHQRGDLDADGPHLPIEVVRSHALQRALEPPLGKAAGQEEDALGHGRYRCMRRILAENWPTGSRGAAGAEALCRSDRNPEPPARRYRPLGLGVVGCCDAGGFAPEPLEEYRESGIDIARQPRKGSRLQAGSDGMVAHRMRGAGVQPQS